MVNMELHVRAADSDAVLRSLGATGCFQPIYPDGASPDSCGSAGAALRKFSAASAASPASGDSGAELCISGWVPRDRTGAIGETVRSVASGPVVVEIHGPAQCLYEKKLSREDIPVLFRDNTFLSGFRPLVETYATPCYGDTDPAPFVAFFFVILFALMFGDLGQGAVIFCLGLAARRTKKGMLVLARAYWPVLVSAGAGSMFAGLLDGSFFANEELLIPLGRSLTGFFLGASRDRFVSILPEAGLGPTLHYFAFGLAVGVVINLTGMLINCVNLWRQGERLEAIFSETGIISVALYVWGVGMAVRAAVGLELAWFDVVGLGVPLSLLLFSRPLERLGESFLHAGEPSARFSPRSVPRRPEPDSCSDSGFNSRPPADNAARQTETEGEGFFACCIESLTEVFLVCAELLANSLTFLMVGAYALSHALLSQAFSKVAGLARISLPGGVFWQILIYAIGNVIILTLEGTIVVVQYLRLLDNEFFPKFFARSGRPFVPLCFTEEPDKPNRSP